MIKTKYLGYQLYEISDQDGVWFAEYWDDSDWKVRPINGQGHTPEAAVADAQRMIQESQGLRKRG